MTWPRTAEVERERGYSAHRVFAGAERMRRYRRRRQKGMRCVTIELRETEIDALIRRGRLAPDSRADLAAVRKALYGFSTIICSDAQHSTKGADVMRHG